MRPPTSTRALLIPKSHCRPLADILAASWEHFALTHRKLLVEYVLLRGVNDSKEDAKRLAHTTAWARGGGQSALVEPRPVAAAPKKAESASRPGSPPVRRATFQPSLPASVAAFRETLLEARIETVVRQGRGVDIEAACGQLAGRRLGYEQVSGDQSGATTS